MNELDCLSTNRELTTFIPRLPDPDPDVSLRFTPQFSPMDQAQVSSSGCATFETRLIVCALQPLSKPVPCVQAHFAASDAATAASLGVLDLPQWLLTDPSADPLITFTFSGGTPATRMHAWRAAWMFSTHSKAHVMPEQVTVAGDPGDPGQGVGLPVVYRDYSALLHLLACLTDHPSGKGARGSGTALSIAFDEHPAVSIAF